jgi:hypothetical protein
MKYDPRLITFRTPSGWRRRRPDEKIQATDRVGASGMTHWTIIAGSFVGRTPKDLEQSWTFISIICPKD